MDKLLIAHSRRDTEIIVELQKGFLAGRSAREQQRRKIPEPNSFYISLDAKLNILAGQERTLCSDMAEDCPGL
jgi:hypothetical protein